MTQAKCPWAIEADAVRYAYSNGDEPAVDLSFRVQPGELVAVMGPNGAGKTTLMKILLRLLRPQQGCVRLSGIDIAGLRPAELYHQVGMVLQNPADQLFGTTVEEDVAFGPRNLGLPEAEVDERIDEAIAAVDARAVRQRPIHRLSFGEQKRVCLAGVLAMRPEILVLDEPIAGLDPASESRILELLLDLNRRGTTIIVSTHAVDLLPVAAHRVAVIVGGRVQCEGPPHAVFSDPVAVARWGLRLPLVAQLFHGLREHGRRAGDSIPLTVDDARRQILSWLGGTP